MNFIRSFTIHSTLYQCIFIQHFEEFISSTFPEYLCNIITLDILIVLKTFKSIFLHICI